MRWVAVSPQAPRQEAACARLAPQNRRTAVARLTSQRECHRALCVNAQPRVTWIVRTALCRDGI
ncbi:MAG TPA: hypothetical protein VMV92_34945 [Streptosporangiaceae bacterium]|nr:hypothetical protein [Streptosporangiaceae bacterium]